jgi:acetyl esterase/lipase
MTFEEYQAAMDVELRAGFTRMFEPARAGEPVADGLPARRRQVAQFAARTRQQLPSNHRVLATDRRVPGQQGAPDVSVRVYSPSQPTADVPAVMWIHGGAFVLGTADQDEALCQCVVERVGGIVVSVDYRLAPEHPFPAALDDCYAALQWMKANAADLRLDASRIAVAGASSGGTLAASVALLARDRGEIALAFQLLLYPCLDDRLASSSSAEFATPGMISNREDVWLGWRAYLGAYSTGEIPPYAVPARAGDLGRLPPAYVMTGELDALRDEDVAYAMRLMEAGVRTELHVYPGAFHGFDKMVATAALSRRAVHEYLTGLNEALNLKTRNLKDTAPSSLT